MITFRQVGKMRQGLHLTRLEEQAARSAYAKFRAEADWAFGRRFKLFEGTYVFAAGVPALVLAWHHTEHPTYFVLLLAGGSKFLILLTEFSEDFSLTTGSARQSHLFPQAPGRYTQTFSGLSLDDLLDRRLAAARYVTTLGGVGVKPVPWEFEEAFARGEMVQAAYVQSLPGWFLRAPYWYYFRTTRLHNKTIEQLHKSRRVLLPNDRHFQELRLPD